MNFTIITLVLLNSVVGVPLYGQCGGADYRGSTQCEQDLQCFRRSKWYSSCQKTCPVGLGWECEIGININTGAGQAAAQPWNQCGGNGWRGLTRCTPGYQCYARSVWYAQCRPNCPAGWICSNSMVAATTRTPTDLPASTGQPFSTTIVATNASTIAAPVMESSEELFPETVTNGPVFETSEEQANSESEETEFDGSEEFESNGSEETDGHESTDLSDEEYDEFHDGYDIGNGLSGEEYDEGDFEISHRRYKRAVGKTVQQVINAGKCSTEPVGGLSRQLVSMLNKIVPNTMVNLNTVSGIQLSSAAKQVPYVQPSVLEQINEIVKSRGVKLLINSALRTVPQQLLLFKWFQAEKCNIKLAATPGRSPHELGIGIDVSNHAAWRTAMENYGCKWHGVRDPPHYTCKNSNVKDIASKSVLAFQALWNCHNPDDRIAEDGIYGTQTEMRVLRSPADGWREQLTCDGETEATVNEIEGGETEAEVDGIEEGEDGYGIYDFEEYLDYEENEIDEAEEELTSNIPSSEILGRLSAKYESGTRGSGTINRYKTSAKGDPGGASYGLYQIATKTGTMKNFLKWINSNYPNIAHKFNGLTPATADFDAAWKNLAKEQPDDFRHVQHEFIKQSHYDVTLAALRTTYGDKLNLDERSPVIKDVIWSTSVQHGPSGGAKVIRRALGGQNLQSLTDEEFITHVYRERGADNGKKYFSKSKLEIRKGVVRRFIDEKKDALKQLNE